MKLKSKIAILVPLTVVFFSCKKQNTNDIITTTQKGDLASLTTQKAPTPEPVNAALLQKYIDYQLSLDKADMLTKSGVKTEVKPTMTMAEFNAMLDNYLVNQANQMRQNYFLKSGGGVVTNYAPLPPAPDDTTTVTLPVVVVCSGTFTAPNTTNTILFQATVLPANTLTSATFAFAGISGTMTQTGSLIQSTSQGVITYRQNYQETYTVNGVTYTQLFAVYGNVYHGACTVQGMQIIAQP